MATYSSILAWRIPWTEKPGRLQSMGWQRVGHGWSDWARKKIWTLFVISLEQRHLPEIQRDMTWQTHLSKREEFPGRLIKPNCWLDKGLVKSKTWNHDQMSSTLFSWFLLLNRNFISQISMRLKTWPSVVLETHDSCHPCVPSSSSTNFRNESDAGS